MLFWLPVYIQVEVASKEEADVKKRVLENLLQNGMVVGTIQAQLPNRGISVGDPQLINVPPRK